MNGKQIIILSAVNTIKAIKYLLSDLVKYKVKKGIVNNIVKMQNIPIIIKKLCL